MPDQSIKRGSSVNELGDRRDVAHRANGRHGCGLPTFANPTAKDKIAPIPARSQKAIEP
jgi:hypothetical protein